MNRTRT